MNVWSFYDLSTGEFTGRSRRRATIGTDIPAGCGFVAGLYDRRCWRVDLESGAVVERDLTDQERSSIFGRRMLAEERRKKRQQPPLI